MSYSSIRQKLENAFAAYIDANKAGLTINVPVHSGQIGSEERTFPCIVAKTISSKELYKPGSGAYEATVDIMVFTQFDDEPAGTAAERVGTLKDILSNIETVKAALNKPASGPDTRAVKEITVTGYLLTDEPDDQSERHWEDTIRLKVFAHPWDPA